MKKNAILVADDQEINRVIIKQIFSAYETFEAVNGRECLQILEKEHERLAVILLDCVMPVMNGLEVLDAMLRLPYAKTIPVIMITGMNIDNIESDAYERGIADIIYKPFHSSIVYKRVMNTIELYQHKNELEALVQEQFQKLEQKNELLAHLNEALIDSLSTIVEFRNTESGMHIRRISELTRIMLKELQNKPEFGLTDQKIDKIASAAMLHDFGKIAIPDAVLLKPGKLTPEEFEIMKTHCEQGCALLKRVSFLEDRELYQYSYEICLSHHERYDGRGYPQHLKGDQIPLSAQVVSVADVYDALVSDRCYKKAYPHEQAVKMILDGECGTFSPLMIDVFVKVQDKMNACVQRLNAMP
jgi:putative two-component system response regulator